MGSTLQVAGINVANQIFGVAENIVVYRCLYEIDGVDGDLGLGWPSAIEGDFQPVFQNMVLQRLVDDPIFGFYLKRYMLSYSCMHVAIALFQD